jgi:HK97 family phage portal protein
MGRWTDLWLPPIFTMARKATDAPASGGGNSLATFVGPQAASYPSARNFAGMVHHGFSENPYLFRAVMYTANSCAGIPWLLYDKRGKERTEVTDHPLLTLMNARANRRESAARLWIRSHSLLLLSGDAYLIALTTTREKSVAELYAVRSDRMKADTNRTTGELIRWVYSANGHDKQYYDPSDVRYITEFSPEDDNTGLAPAKVAARAVDQHNAANDWNTALLQNMARPSGMLTPQSSGGQPVVIPADVHETLKNDLEARYSGPRNAGKPLIPRAPMTWEKMGENPSEMDWLDGKAHAAREIAIALAVPPELLGDSANKTHANYESARKAFYQETILPRMDVLKGELNSWLLPLYGMDTERYELDYDTDDIEALQEDRQAIYQRAYQGWTAGLLTLDQSLKMIGESEVGGDLGGVRIIPSTYVPLEQAVEPPAPVPDVLKPFAGQNNPPDEGADADTPPTDNQPPAKRRPRAANKALRLDTEEQKAAHWKRTETSREAWYGAVSDQVAAQFESERKAVVKALKSAGAGKGAIKAAQKVISDGDWKDLLAAIHVAVGGPFAVQAVEDITDEAKARRIPARKAAAESALLDEWQTFVAQYLNTDGAQRIKGITETTRARIQTTLADGIAHEETIDQLATRLEDVYSGFKGYRAELVSRTEVLAASNAGSIYGARSTGLDLQKEWIATRDDRTRDDHADADGQIVDLDEPFIVGGEECDTPGTTGDPAQDCACRCTQGYHVRG